MEAENTVNDKMIENDLMRGLKNADQDQGSNVSTPDLPPQDFISDDVLRFVLGHKNKYFVRVLGKELGESPLKMLESLYVLTDDERRIYKTVIQDFIRENFPQWEEKISKISSGAVVSLAILEIGRIHEARILIKADADIKAKAEKAAA